MIKEIKSKLESEEYDFLRNTEELQENIILLTTGGSYAYGTNVKNSDIDIRGISLNTKEEILTMNCREKPFEHKETDTVIYTMKHIIQLLISCNPNVLEMMGTKNEHLFVLTEEGKLLRDNVDLFLSKKVMNSFGGYATSQLRRLQNALARDSYPKEEKEQHILNSLRVQMEHFKTHYENFEDYGNIDLYIDESKKEGYEKEIFMNIDLRGYPLRDFKNIYSEMNNVLRDYDKLNHRNKKKDELHLNKHAMHLIRLLIMGTEILEGKGINTYREYDREFLLEIRDGKFNYDEIFKIVDKYEERFKYACDNTNLPQQPKYKEIEELTMQINKRRIL